MSERRGYVLQAPLGRAIWSLSWPIALSNELSILTLSVLLFWLGRLIGESGLAVESLFRPVGLLVAWFFAATSVGGTALVSRSVGAADGRGLTIAAAAVTLTIAMWIVLLAVCLPLSPLIAHALAGGLPIERPMLHFVIGWLVVYLPGLSVAEVLLDVAGATGATKFNLARVLVDLVLMLGLTPVLMDTLGMGIAGGPISEGLAGAGLYVVMWVALVRRRVAFALGELEPGAWRIRWSLWKDVLAIGVPVQIGRMVMFVAQLVLVQLVARSGEASVAGFGVAGALLLFGTMASLALAQGGAILVGQALGAGLHDRARRAVRVTLLAGWIAMAAFVIATLFAHWLIVLFTSDPKVEAVAAHALSILRWAGFGIATWQILLACFAAYRATVRAGLLMIAGESVGVALAFLLPGSQLDAVCTAIVVANVVKALLLLWLLVTGVTTRRTAAG